MPHLTTIKPNWIRIINRHCERLLRLSTIRIDISGIEAAVGRRAWRREGPLDDVVSARIEVEDHSVAFGGVRCVGGGEAGLADGDVVGCCVGGGEEKGEEES